MWVVIDHMRGQRRGQRQEIDLSERLAIGRHPDCDVSFDMRRDLEASTRHAELRVRGEKVVLIDVGSSNGTYIGGQRVSEAALVAGEATLVEFGAAGPQLRIWWDPTQPPSEGPPLPRRGIPWPVFAGGAALVLLGAFVLLRLVLGAW